MSARYSSPLFLLVAFCACSGTTQSTGALPREEVRRKLLRYQEVQLHQRQFFVGLAAAATLDRATEAAYQEITRQLTWLPAGSQDMLRGMYRVDRSAQDSSGDVHVLAVLEREAAAAYLRKQAREVEEPVRVKLQGCQSQLKAGELQSAQACLEEGKRQLARVRELITAARAAVGDLARPTLLPAEELAEKLEGQITGGQTQRRSALIHVLRELDGQAAGDLDGELASMCTDLGLKRVSADIPAAVVRQALEGRASGLLSLARSAGAGYAIVGAIKGRFSSEDSGQFFSFADGGLKVFESTGGRIVAEVACQEVKGGHISRQQANEKAVKEALVRLKGQLQAKLNAIVPK
jgi:hypothetical protein